MRFWRIAAYAAAVLVLALGMLVAWVALTHEEFASVDFLNPDLWKDAPNGYVASINLERSGMVCLCGGYECPREFQVRFTKVEPTHIAFEGFWRPLYSIVKDPAAGDHPNWGRMVFASQTCVEREAGQIVTLFLQPSGKDDWLKLSME